MFLKYFDWKGESDRQSTVGQKRFFLLDCVLIRPDRDAVHELEGRPQSVELDTLVHVHDSVRRGRASPDGVVQEAPDAREDDFKDGEAAAEPFPRQQVAFFGDDALLLKHGRNI